MPKRSRRDTNKTRTGRDDYDLARRFRGGFGGSGGRHPAGNRHRTLAGGLVVFDPGEDAAQLDRSRKFTAGLIHAANRRSFRFGHCEHGANVDALGGPCKSTTPLPPGFASGITGITGGLAFCLYCHFLGGSLGRQPLFLCFLSRLGGSLGGLHSGLTRDFGFPRRLAFSSAEIPGIADCLSRGLLLFHDWIIWGRSGLKPGQRSLLCRGCGTQSVAEISAVMRA
jgi:hypothetical protein